MAEAKGINPQITTEVNEELKEMATEVTEEVKEATAEMVETLRPAKKRRAWYYWTS
jgi:vacuolar-type H+-ATPase subunit E/Vma4